MKASLLFANPSEKYQYPWSIEKINHPLQSGLAILAKNLEAEIPDIKVECYGNQVVTGKTNDDYSHRYRTTEEFVELSKDSDFVGISVLLNNLSSSIDIAERIKEQHPEKTVFLGGPGISDKRGARLVMEKHKAVDYIIAGDGEMPICDLINGIEEGLVPENIAHLYFRDGKNVKRSKNRFSSDLNKRRIWDFSNTPDLEDTMRAFDSRTKLYRDLREEYGNFIGMVGVQLSKGCEKAEKMGRCSYCVSGRDPKVEIRDAEKFWEQVLHLNEQHGITEYFIVDNVVATPKKLDALETAMQKFSIPEEIQFRGYGYVPFFFEEGGDQMMAKLHEIGVKNLFIGVENFDMNVNRYSNKPGFEFSEVYSIVKQANDHQIDMFLPVLVGLPGDSKKAMEKNMYCMEKLLSDFGNVEYGKGGLVRVDLSIAMPLRGTPWFEKLVSIPEVRDLYIDNTGVDLIEHIDPDYELLRDASLKFYHHAGIDDKDIKDFERDFSDMCLKYIRPEQIGRFDPSSVEKGD